MKNYFQRFHRFLLCFLQVQCQYDSKKLLSFIFSALALYLAIWTTKADFFVETLSFVAVLLGLRVWEKRKTVPESNENLG